MDLSVIIPVYNEEESIPELAAEVEAALRGTELSWECVWVNDGSTDATVDVLAGLHAKDTRHVAVTHDGNFGQSAGLATGFAHARGAVFATLDGDGQNDPADIPKLLDRLSQGDVGMVNGIRVTRRDTFVRRMSSKIANGMRRAVLHDGVTDVGCALRVMRRDAVEALPVFKGMHRFLPALARANGYVCTELPVNHRPRMKGVAKYGVGNRLWVGIADLIGVRWWLARRVRPRVRSASGEFQRTPAA